MIKDESKNKENDELVEDLQFMLSSIRARENTLIFYLERWRNCANKTSTDFKLAKNQFQQKQKIYSRQVTTILQKHCEFSFGNLHAVRAFWIKLKTIIKVSIQRISTMGLPTVNKIQENYEKALTVCTRNLDSQKGLIAYRQVENIFKKRTIQVLLFGREGNSPSSISYSESKIQKNRSQTLFKQQTAISRFTIENQDSNVFTKGETYTLISKERLPRQQYLNGLADIKQENGLSNQPKIKSLNRIKNRRPEDTIKANIMNFIKVQQLGKLKSTSKASEKYIKKINKHVDRYEKNFQGAFDGKYEVTTLLDKKKTIVENIYSLYDDLFAKNIPNHKMIAKFMFNTTKINQILYNAYQKKKKINNKKDKEKDKDKQKQKQKQKERSTVDKDWKQKESSGGHKKKQNKDKESDEKEKPTTVKSSKANRKYYLSKDYPYQFQILNINTKEKQQHVREKKESEMTAITSKNNTHHKEPHEKTHEKHEKAQKDKQKSDKDKQKKIQRSKTAKIKLNSEAEIQNFQAMNHNFIVGKHFISQHNGQRLHSKGNTEKLVKTIGI